MLKPRGCGRQNKWPGVWCRWPQSKMLGWDGRKVDNTGRHQRGLITALECQKGTKRTSDDMTVWVCLRKASSRP